MEKFFEGFMGAFINYILTTTTSIIDFATQAVLSVFSLQTDGYGLFTTISEYIPFMKNGRTLLFWVGISVATCLVIYNVVKLIFVEKSDPPLTIIGRAISSFILIGLSFSICDYILQLTGIFYTAVWAMDVAIDTTNMFTQMKGGLVNNTVLLATGVGPIIALIVILAIGWNYLKLLLEIVERYLVTGVLSISSPLAASTLASSSTSNIFGAWLQMFISQCFLLIMSIFFLRGFNSAVAAYPVHQGGTSTSVLTFTDSMFKEMPAGGLMTWLITMLGYLIVAQRMDRYMSNAGLGVAQTGGNFLGEMAIAGRTIQGGVGAITNSGSGIAAFNMSGKGQSIASTQLGQAYSQFTGKNSFGAITSGMKSETGASFGITTKNGATRVNATPAENIPLNAKGGLFSNTPDGKSFVTAKGPDDATVLSPISSCPEDYRNTAKQWNEDYLRAIGAGNNNPSDYADAMALDRAAEGNSSVDMLQHNDEIAATFGSALGLENASMQIDPEMPGKLDYAGTTADGEFVQGSLMAESLVDTSDIPTETVIDSSGNAWKKSTEAMMPEYGEGVLSGVSSPGFEQMSNNLSDAYVDTVASAYAAGQDGLEAGRSYLEDQGISDLAISGMEERLSESMQEYSSYGDAQAAEMSRATLGNYVQYSSGHTPLQYFQQEHFPNIGQSLDGPITSLDFNDRGTGVLYCTTTNAKGSESLYRLSDANQNIKPVGSKEINDRRGSKYYVEQMPINNGESVAQTKKRMPQLRRVQAPRSLRREFEVKLPKKRRSLFK